MSEQRHPEAPRTPRTPGSPDGHPAGRPGAAPSPDPLTLALTGEPVPEPLAGDPRFRSEHRAAVDDVRVLREQIRLLGDVLGGRDAPVAATGAISATGATDESATASAGRAIQATQAAQTAGAAEVVRAARGAEAVGALGAAEVAEVAERAEAVERAGAAGMTLPERRARGRGRGRLAVVFGALAAACAVALVCTVGRLAVEGGKGASDAGAAADAAAGPARPSAAPETGRAPARYTACARLIVEGTVERVEPVAGESAVRVTLRVDRYYKPAGGAARITFVQDDDAVPGPHPGARLLAGFPVDGERPDLWAMSDADGDDLASTRAWVERGLAADSGANASSAPGDACP